TTPFDMRVFSELDRFHLAQDAAKAVYAEDAKGFLAEMDETLAKHHDFIRTEGRDIPEVENWKWEELKRKEYHFS
ncbi:MAG: phosphoketolase family protein, partial [Enterococcus hulanensis]